MFSTRLDNLLSFSSNLKLSSANSFSLEESKILSSGNGLIGHGSFTYTIYFANDTVNIGRCQQLNGKPQQQQLQYYEQIRSRVLFANPGKQRFK